MWKILVATLGIAGAACGANPGQADSLTLARLEASETKLAQLEERLASIEAKTGRLDGVAEGIQVLLEKLDQVGGKQEAKRPDPKVSYSLPIEGDPYMGPKHAKVTIVNGYDFYCGYCDKARPAMDELRKIYKDDVKVVFKNFVIHDNYARLPALAACAAHKQGKFMPMFDQIWIDGIRSQQELTEEMLVAMTKPLKINRKKFLADMYGDCPDKLRTDFKQLAAVGATGTPAFYINGRFLSGALPVHRYQEIIDEELKKAEQAIASGTKLRDYYPSLVESGKKSL